MPLSDLLPYGYFLVLIAGVVVFWRNGGNQAQKQASDAYKDVAEANEKQVGQLKQQMTELQGQIATLSAKVTELTAVVREKDARIVLLEALVQNRNPEMANFIQRMEGHITDTKNFWVSATQNFADIRNCMQNINMFLTQQASKVAVPASQ